MNHDSKLPTVLPIFNIVHFSNSECPAANSVSQRCNYASMILKDAKDTACFFRNGTCLSIIECQQGGGTSRGTCAAGWVRCIYISRGCASSVSLRRQIVSSFQFRSMLHFRQGHVRRFRRPELLLCNQSRVSGSLHLRRHLLLSVEKVLAWWVDLATSECAYKFHMDFLRHMRSAIGLRRVQHPRSSAFERQGLQPLLCRRTHHFERRVSKSRSPLMRR